MASTGGQEVKNLGDGLMVAFGSASGAASCAVAMQQLFERRYGQAEQGLHVRIGLGAGESTVKETLVYLDRGAEAAKIIEHAASDRFEHIAADSATLTALALYADAAVETGSSGPASILYELIEPWADQIVWTGVIGYGHARMWLGLLAACMGEHEQADRHLAFACDFQETNGLLLWAARAHLGWAEALAGRGETTRAREHAARAL
jgi:hypothetical protein